jgi:hypothetical protein
MIKTNQKKSRRKSTMDDFYASTESYTEGVDIPVQNYSRPSAQLSEKVTARLESVSREQSNSHTSSIVPFGKKDSRKEFSEPQQDLKFNSNIKVIEMQKELNDLTKENEELLEKIKKMQLEGDLKLQVEENSNYNINKCKVRITPNVDKLSKEYYDKVTNNIQSGIQLSVLDEIIPKELNADLDSNGYKDSILAALSVLDSFKDDVVLKISKDFIDDSVSNLSLLEDNLKNYDFKLKVTNNKTGTPISSPANNTVEKKQLFRSRVSVLPNSLH